MTTLLTSLTTFNQQNNRPKTLVIIGDSFCWGAGIGKEFDGSFPTKQDCRIDDYDHWPANAQGNFAGQIAHDFGMNLINYAMPGCSNDTIFRNFMRFLEECEDILDDCFVMLFWTHNARYEIPDESVNHKFRNLAPQWNKNKKEHTPWVVDYHNLYNEHIWSQKYDDTKSFNYLKATALMLKQLQIHNISSWTILHYEDEFGIEEKASKLGLNFDAQVCEIMKVVVDMEEIYPCKHPMPSGHRKIADALYQVKC